MKNELLLLIKKHTDTLIEQTKTKPRETFEFKMNKRRQTFSFSPPINLVEEGKWLIAFTSFETSNTIPGHWDSKSAEKTKDEINKVLKLWSQKGIELHVKEVRKRGSQIKTKDNEYKVSDFNTKKNEILEEVRKVKDNDFVDLIYKFQLTYDEIIDILDLKNIPTKRTGYSLDPGFYEVSDINKTLEYIFSQKCESSFYN